MDQQNPTPSTLFDLFGLDAIDPKERDEFLVELGGVLYEGVMQRVAGTLKREQQEELAGLLEAQASEPDNTELQSRIESFFATHVPDMERYVSEEIVRLQEAHQEILGDLNAS